MEEFAACSNPKRYERLSVSSFSRGGGVIAEAQAQTTLSPVIVFGYPSGGGLGGGGGGGGFGGGASTYGNEDPGQGYDPACDLLWPQAAEADCRLGSPPPPVVNGCGAAGTIDVVPDGLIGVPQFGNIFTPACDAHDTCYGTYGTDKHGCDRKLRDDMVDRCKVVMDAQEEAIWMNSCVIQADQYSATLQNPFVEYLVSNSAFIKAQDDGFCRLLTDEARALACL